jgi:lipoprotein NlpD
MKKTRLLIVMVACALAAACTTTRNAAPVYERGAAGQAAVAGGTRADARGYYTVRKGDTLFRIALEFGQSYRDIVAWNNLSDPNDIKIDQVLRVSPPASHAIAGSAQTDGVATSGVEVRPLVVPVTPVPVATNKTGPRAEKSPYSESNLAELKKPDPTAPAPVAALPAIAKVESSPMAEIRPGGVTVEKPVLPIAPSEENVSWIWPAEGKILASFDENKRGIDIAGKPGQEVLAAGSGKVMYAGSGIRGYGNLVIVKHTNNLLSAYAHNKSIMVKEGQNVTRGQKIAEMGNSDTDAVKLHFEIRQQGKPVDPSKFLPTR